MQHSDSQSSIEVVKERADGSTSLLWFALAFGVVGLALALTYALARLISTGWVFVS